jgi:hypothetical protein
MKYTHRIARWIGRSALVGAGYLLAMLLIGTLINIMIPPAAATGRSGSSLLLLLLFLSGFLLALFLGPVAMNMPASRGRHFAVWASVIFFNMGSVAIEGAFFAPELVPMPLPILFVQQLLASLAAAVLITRLFAAVGAARPIRAILSERSRFSWLVRFLVSSFSYLLFYFIFGAVNYNLITQPYYAAHAGGLLVPDPGVVLAVEMVRAPLIVLSVLLLVFSFPAPSRRLMLLTGGMLFWVGGLVPLMLQVGTLPLFLLLASAVEIFLQNSLTGVVAGKLLALSDTVRILPPS